MNGEDFLMVFDSIVATVLFWLLIGVLALYFGRSPAQRAIRSMVRIVHQAIRLAAAATQRTHDRLEARNREVLLAAGREAKERIIEREFERIGATVDRDLARYPEVQRLVSESIQKIDEDLQRTAEVPPEVPGWTRAVEAVAKVPGKADSTLRDVLEAIHEAVEDAHERSLSDYRKASRKRHRVLSRMMPEWRRIQRSLTDMHAAVMSLLERSRSIDRHMDEYQQIVQGTDRAVASLASSSLVQFFVSMLVIAVAVGGAVINFSLIARPMAEMVGGTSYIGSFQTADIAALVIILVEISMGLFLMESLRITRLFPVVGALPDRLRVRMIWITFAILALLATVEAGLAYMREVLLQDELATTALLRGDAEATGTTDALWITTAAQMGMGFVLPFALTFVAIPLESFVHTLRNVSGAVVAVMLRFVTLALRMLANGVRQVGAVLLHLYDLVIFAPLWVEARFRPRDERAVRAPVIEPAQEHAFEPAPRDNADEREHREDHHFDRYGEARA
jgi:hypothetical protein